MVKTIIIPKFNRKTGKVRTHVRVYRGIGTHPKLDRIPSHLEFRDNYGQFYKKKKVKK